MRTHRIDQLANSISYLLCPPCVATGGIFLAAAIHPAPQTWWYAMTYVGLAVVLPLLLLLWFLYRGKVSDLDVSQRHERPLLFAIALGGTILAWAYLARSGAPILLVQFAFAHTIVLATVLVITIYWKISMHSAGAAAIATLASALLGGQTLVYTPVLVVAWARLRLKRHTLAQVLAGGLLGGGVFLVLFPSS